MKKLLISNIFEGKEVKNMKKLLVILVAAVFVLSMASVAWAHVAEIRLGSSVSDPAGEYLGRASTTSITYPVKYRLQGRPITAGSQVIYNGLAPPTGTVAGTVVSPKPPINTLVEGTNYTMDDETGEVTITSGLTLGWYMYARYTGDSEAEPETVVLYVGDSETVEVYTELSAVDGTVVTATSADSSVASVAPASQVTSGGKATFTITCHKKGTTTITFSAPGYASATLTVKQVEPSTVTDPVGDTPYTFVESESDTAVPMKGFSNDPFPSGDWKMGASAWRYKDSWDAAAKYEGSYREFDDTSGAGLYTYRSPVAVTAEYMGSTSTTITYPVFWVLAKAPVTNVVIWKGTSSTVSTPNPPGNTLAPANYIVDLATGAITVNTGLATSGYYWASYTGTTGLAGPHGGYDTASNKCKTCHAVHRASGGFKLMRVDDPNDACNYCHTGSHPHSNRAAYSAGNGTKYTANGHTIGSGKSIPDSTTWQWLEEKTLTGGDEGEFEATVKIRRYEPAKNKIMMWSTERASYHVRESSATLAGGTALLRWGPTLLTCISCHQPHNADKLIWKPDNVSGYKLLRASPSGSVIVPVGKDRAGGTTGKLFTEAEAKAWMVTYSEWSINYPEAMAKAIQKELNASNTGMSNWLGAAGWPNTANGNSGKTIYTQWKSSAMAVDEKAGSLVVPRLSVWCADCHNLNIGYYEQIGEPNFRGEETGQYHSDRTHSAGGRIECWSCHNTSLGDQSYGDDPGTTAVDPQRYGLAGCSKCHWYSNGATMYATHNAGSDFPHSGATQSTKLLDDAYNATTEHLDQICIRCHDLVGTSM